MTSAGKLTKPVCEDKQVLADGLAALAHPHRLEILQVLGGCSCACCGEVVQHLPIAQSTVSQHLKILAKAGLITVNSAGQKSLYSVNSEALTKLLSDVAGLKACCSDPSCLTQKG